MTLARFIGGLVFAAVIALAIWIAYVWAHPFRPQGLVDGRTWTSPDGSLVASELVDDHDHGLGNPPWFGIAISPKDGDPLTGKVVVFGGDFQAKWSAADHLNIIPYCDGWIEEAKNRAEISRRQITIDISPMTQCLRTEAS